MVTCSLTLGLYSKNISYHTSKRIKEEIDGLVTGSKNP